MKKKAKTKSKVVTGQKASKQLRVLKKPATCPRPVSFKKNDLDWEVVKLGRLGLHAEAIAEATGYTESQVTYRLRQAGVSTRDYRNGKTPEFRRITALAGEIWSKAKADALRTECEKRHHDILDELIALRDTERRQRETLKLLRTMVKH